MYPVNQKRLYGLDKYLLEIIDLFRNNKLPNKILLTGNKGIGKSTLCYHLMNYIFSKNEPNQYDLKKFSIHNENKSFKLINNNSHPNFYLIDLLNDKKNIEINQIRQMITYTNKSNFNELPRFIIIDNVENLNINSVNALLKVVEEPNENIYFILIHNNNKKILSTLKSRCLLFKISLTFEETLNITNSLLGENIFDLINDDLINYYNTAGELVSLVNFSKEKKIDLKELNLNKFLLLLIDNGYYKKNSFVKNLIINFIELHFLKVYKTSNTKEKILVVYNSIIKKIDDTNKFNLDDESLFMEFKSKILNG